MWSALQSILAHHDFVEKTLWKLNLVWDLSLSFSLSLSLFSFFPSPRLSVSFPDITIHSVALFLILQYLFSRVSITLKIQLIEVFYFSQEFINNLKGHKKFFKIVEVNSVSNLFWDIDKGILLACEPQCFGDLIYIRFYAVSSPPPPSLSLSLSLSPPQSFSVIHTSAMPFVLLKPQLVWLVLVRLILITLAFLIFHVFCLFTFFFFFFFW